MNFAKLEKSFSAVPNTSGDSRILLVFHLLREVCRIGKILRDTGKALDTTGAGLASLLQYKDLPEVNVKPGKPVKTVSTADWKTNSPYVWAEREKFLQHVQHCCEHSQNLTLFAGYVAEFRTILTTLQGIKPQSRYAADVLSAIIAATKVRERWNGYRPSLQPIDGIQGRVQEYLAGGIPEKLQCTWYVRSGRDKAKPGKVSVVRGESAWNSRTVSPDDNRDILVKTAGLAKYARRAKVHNNSPALLEFVGFAGKYMLDDDSINRGGWGYDHAFGFHAFLMSDAFHHTWNTLNESFGKPIVRNCGESGCMLSFQRRVLKQLANLAKYASLNLSGRNEFPQLRISAPEQLSSVPGSAWFENWTGEIPIVRLSVAARVVPSNWGWSRGSVEIVSEYAFGKTGIEIIDNITRHVSTYHSPRPEKVKGEFCSEAVNVLRQRLTDVIRRLPENSPAIITPRQRKARLLEKLRKLSQVSLQDSLAYGNCLQGSKHFMETLGVSGETISGDMLARAWRKAGYPENRLFTGLVEYLASKIADQSAA